MKKRFPKYFPFLESCLKVNNGGKGYAVGKKISFADVMLLSIMRGYKGSHKEHYEANKDLPLLKAHEQRMNKEDVIQKFDKSDRTCNHYYDSFM